MSESQYWIAPPFINILFRLQPLNFKDIHDPLQDTHE